MKSDSVGLLTTLGGLIIFTVGAKPEWLGLERSPGVGFVQIPVFLFGLALICLGGLAGMRALWKGLQPTIVSDIGTRLVGTGYLMAIVAGLADLLGFGSQPQTPYFGPVEAAGVEIGQAVIAIGFLMLIPYRSFLKRKRAA